MTKVLEFPTNDLDFQLNLLSLLKELEEDCEDGSLYALSATVIYKENGKKKTKGIWLKREEVNDWEMVGITQILLQALIEKSKADIIKNG